METTIYLIRHSKPLKIKENLESNDSLQIQNEKNPLSVEGEEKAKLLSEQESFQNIDVVISSNYVRSIATAKYIAEKNNTKVLIMDDFGERKHGINSWEELPENFEKRQLENKDYKIGSGESHQEVANRMYDALMKVLSNYQGKKITIVSHATAMIFLFISLTTYQNNKLYFEDKLLIDENFEWDAPEVFELKFNEENELISIINKRTN